MKVRTRLATFAAVAASLGLLLTGCTGSADTEATTGASASANVSVSGTPPTISASKDASTPARKAYVANPTKPCDAMSAKELNKLLGDNASYGEGRMEDLGSYALATDMTYDPRECVYTNKDGNVISVSTRFGFQSLCGTAVCTFEHPYKELKKVSLRDYNAMAGTVGEYKQEHQKLSLRPNGDDEALGAEFATLRFFDGYNDGTCVTSVCASHIAADFFYSYEAPKEVNISTLMVVSGTNVSLPQIQKVLHYVTRTVEMNPEVLTNN